ncbi:unnamed protein product [Effrenium voratum]|nr:unnamed protein product [Effrenium voratum]
MTRSSAAMAEQRPAKRLKRPHPICRSYATSQAHSWPLVPGVLVLEICRWLGGDQKVASKESRRQVARLAEAIGAAWCVDRFWRRCCEAACWELFSQEFQQVVRGRFNPLRAAQQLTAWWEKSKGALSWKHRWLAWWRSPNLPPRAEA